MSIPGDEKMVVQLTVGELRALIRAELVASEAGVEHINVQWADVPSASEHFAVTPQTIRNWIKAGAPACQLGTNERPMYRVDIVELDAWLRSHKPAR